MATMTRIAAVVLAGGKAERLGGVNKALIEVGGRRLIDRARDAISGCDPKLVAIGHTPFDAPGFVAVHDLDADYGGPLAGIAAAVEALFETDAELLLSFAVDTPFFPADFLIRALPLLGAASAVLAAFGPQDYPTNALWRLSAIRDLPQAVRSDTAPRSLKRLAESLGAARLDYAGLVSDDPFLNINTPADMVALTSRTMQENDGQMPLGKGNQNR
jgi:molybdopterin-guanine dinucleotide biosynthesis protein A